MGKSLSRNLARNGFSLSMYNRHVSEKEENVASDFKDQYSELGTALPFDDLNAFIGSIKMPRKIILMVNAGPTIDIVLDELSSLLDKGDIVIDAGNSHFEETNRRIKSMKEKGFHFIGTGVSGGEEGALIGPSIMPSGDADAYKQVQNYLETIAAKDPNQDACCTYVGAEGSGHFVKMIHNGIEYAEMQLLAECYTLLKVQGKTNEEMADIFESWIEDLGSYLLEITINILRKKEGEGYLLDLILDKAANKGTGKWATSSIADSGEAATMIPAALFARYLSFFKEKRLRTAKTFRTKSSSQIDIPISQLKDAYQFSRIINHHQGFSIIKRVSDQRNWNVNLSEVARIWTEGCIIKSDFMKDIVQFLKMDPSLLLNKNIIPVIQKAHSSIQAVTKASIENEIHIPCLLEALNFYHGIKTEYSSANLIQAQRDYFGAHTYKKINDPSGDSYHTEW